MVLLAVVKKSDITAPGQQALQPVTPAFHPILAPHHNDGFAGAFCVMIVTTGEA